MRSITVRRNHRPLLICSCQKKNDRHRWYVLYTVYQGHRSVTLISCKSLSSYNLYLLLCQHFFLFSPQTICYRYEEVVKTPHLTFDLSCSFLVRICSLCTDPHLMNSHCLSVTLQPVSSVIGCQLGTASVICLLKVAFEQVIDVKKSSLVLQSAYLLACLCSCIC